IHRFCWYLKVYNAARAAAAAARRAAASEAVTSLSLNRRCLMLLLLLLLLLRALAKAGPQTALIAAGPALLPISDGDFAGVVASDAAELLAADGATTEEGLAGVAAAGVAAGRLTMASSASLTPAEAGAPATPAGDSGTSAAPPGADGLAAGLAGDMPARATGPSAEARRTRNQRRNEWRRRLRGTAGRPPAEGEPREGEAAVGPKGTTATPAPQDTTPAGEPPSIPATSAAGPSGTAATNYASKVKLQPAVIVFGEEQDLTADELDSAWRTIDAALIDQLLAGHPVSVVKSAKTDSCIFIWCSSEESSRNLRELLPKLNWPKKLGKLVFASEGERQKTQRFRVWIPASSAIKSGDQLRQILLKLHPDLKVNGLLHHATSRKEKGATVILGLSDDWAKRLPPKSTIHIGLTQLTILRCEERKADEAKNAKASETGTGAQAPPAKKLRQTADPMPGKAVRAAETGNRNRRPARSTRRSGLIQRALDQAKNLRAHCERARASRAPPQQPEGQTLNGEAPTDWFESVTHQEAGATRIDLTDEAEGTGSDSTEARRRGDGNVHAGLTSAEDSTATLTAEDAETPMEINLQHCVAASVNLMRYAELDKPGLILVQEPWTLRACIFASKTLSAWLRSDLSNRDICVIQSEDLLPGKTTLIASSIGAWRVLPVSSLSDHKFISFNLMAPRSATRVMWRRNARNTDWETFGLALKEFHRSPGQPSTITSCREADECATVLTETLTAAFEASCPLKAYKGKKSAPWWNPELGNLRRRAKRLHRRATKTKSPADQTTYHEAIHEFKRQVRNAKAQKWRQYCEELEGSRPTSRVVKALTLDKMSKLSSVKRTDGTSTDNPGETLDNFIYAAEQWADCCGLRLSETKTAAIMFTSRTKWQIRPLTLYGREIPFCKQTKCLGITLDHRLNWSPHVQTKAKKAFAVLAQLRRAVGTTWGLTPKRLWWIYTAMRYKVTIPSRDAANDHWNFQEVHCYTDGSIKDGRAGFGVCIIINGRVIATHAQHTGRFSTVFQNEVLAISSCAAELNAKVTRGKTIVIHSDSQAALQALCHTTTNSRTVADCARQLNLLARSNTSSIVRSTTRLTPSTGTDGRAPKTAGNLRAAVPCPSHRLRNILLNQNRKDIRALVMTLTGHGYLARHCFLRGDLESEICPFCECDNEDAQHFNELCPFCNLENEDAKHFVCYCPAFNQDRLNHLGPNLSLDNVCWPENIPRLIWFLQATKRASRVVAYSLLELNHRWANQANVCTEMQWLGLECSWPAADRLPTELIKPPSKLPSKQLRQSNHQQLWQSDSQQPWQDSSQSPGQLSSQQPWLLISNCQQANHRDAKLHRSDISRQHRPQPPPAPQQPTRSHRDVVQQLMAMHGTLLERVMHGIRTYLMRIAHLRLDQVLPQRAYIWPGLQQLRTHYQSGKLFAILHPEVLLALKSQSRSLSLNRKRLLEAPPEASRLTFLARLDLSCNQLRDLPLVLESLELLQHLNLSANQFSDLPLVLASFSRLQYLNLFNNRLCRLEPAVLGCLTSLRTLNLNSNSLASLPAEICRLQRLTTLAANRNQLTSLPVELCALEHLQVLHLAYNQLTALPLEFGCLASLRVLQLQRNCLTELPESAARLHHLEYLDVACNQLQLLPARFGELNLREFYYERNPLIRRDPVHSTQEQEALGLKELCARAVMQELRSRASPLRDQLKAYPQLREQLSQCSRCAVCGGAFLNTWLECVRFEPFSPSGRMSKAGEDVGDGEFGGSDDGEQRQQQQQQPIRWLPIRALVCSYKCFNAQSEFYGLAFLCSPVSVLSSHEGRCSLSSRNSNCQLLAALLLVRGGVNPAQIGLDEAENLSGAHKVVRQEEAQADGQRAQDHGVVHADANLLAVVQSLDVHRASFPSEENSKQKHHAWNCRGSGGGGSSRAPDSRRWSRTGRPGCFHPRNSVAEHAAQRDAQVHVWRAHFDQLDVAIAEAHTDGGGGQADADRGQADDGRRYPTWAVRGRLVGGPWEARGRSVGGPWVARSRGSFDSERHLPNRCWQLLACLDKLNLHLLIA
uniref:Endo/exonuclease/phosphatase domain-containing protein n=1 Tax=Macrostomum lignano TaxID=282301 RepID=A0A1I8IME3_9PLAT